MSFLVTTPGEVNIEIGGLTELYFINHTLHTEECLVHLWGQGRDKENILIIMWKGVIENIYFDM